MTWFPTAELRFENRTVIVRREGPFTVENTQKILQQVWVWRVEEWADANEGDKEWRDVPCVDSTSDGEVGK